MKINNITPEGEVDGVYESGLYQKLSESYNQAIDHAILIVQKYQMSAPLSSPLDRSNRCSSIVHELSKFKKSINP